MKPPEGLQDLVDLCPRKSSADDAMPPPASAGASTPTGSTSTSSVCPPSVVRFKEPSDPSALVHFGDGSKLLMGPPQSQASAVDILVKSQTGGIDNTGEGDPMEEDDKVPMDM